MTEQKYFGRAEPTPYRRSAYYFLGIKQIRLMASSLAFRLVYPPVTFVLRAMLRGLAPRWRVTGRENIPRTGPVILAPNHISNCDPPFVGLSVNRPVWFMAKRELFENPILGAFIRFAQGFPVERGQPRTVLRRAQELLSSGEAVVVYPEGRLSQSGDLQPLLPGVAFLALRARVPIVPVGIVGTKQVLPYGKVIPRPTLARIGIHFGRPLEFTEFEALPAREQRERCMKRLEIALRESIEIAAR